MRNIKHKPHYHAALDMPASLTPCHCSDCDWRGTFADLNAIDDCMLTPGDPSPAGRCPECDTLAYIDQPDEAEHLRALLREAIGLMPLGTRLRADWVERALKTLNPL
jgi:hypothetical protein